MSAITTNQVEWALVDRLGRLLEQPPSKAWSTTETFALFTATLCWVVQHCRIQVVNKRADEAAQSFWRELQGVPISGEPWVVHTAAANRDVRVDHRQVVVPAPSGLEELSVAEFAVHLRNATAHGDARTVEPFNQYDLLLGFTFRCSMPGPNSEAVRVTLLQSDMQRIGYELARQYCGALKSGDAEIDCHAGQIIEVAA